MSVAKRALLLLAIDPGLKGVLISGPAGSAKSLLARSSQTLTGCSPFVELPLNATDDQLLGGIDLEATLAAGKRRALPGALARSDGGALYVDCVNLLDPASADNLAGALEDGVVRFEREGISAALPSRFVFIGTSDPAEGEVSANLRDRVGLLVETGGEDCATEGPDIVEQVLEFDRDPAGFVEGFAVETAAIKAHIEDARVRLPQIPIDREDINRVAQVAMSLGVEGNRADIFSVRAARASAALGGRDSVADEDIVAAIKLVLLPRATRLPAIQPDSESPEAQTADAPEQTNRTSPESTGSAEAGEPDRTPVGNLIIEAIGSPQLNEALALPGGKRIERVRTGSGKRARTTDSSRGRYTGVARFRHGHSRIAVDATLRAAAPHQISRRAKRDAQSSEAEQLLDEDVRRRESRVNILPDDLRFKRFKRRSGALFIFAVDASGSMAVNRMAQAKGAITRLLGDAYFHRDKVALISFRGSQADVLLAPTRSVELAKRLVDAMPTGGGTPVSAGLVKALDLARGARLQKMSQTLVLLFTDGRANVELRAVDGKRSSELNEELRDIGRLLASAGINSLVVDTKSKFVSSGEGALLAQTLGARYLYLPNSGDEALFKVLGEMADTSWASDGIC
jgi:magnesium chelatase subunit D